MNVFFFRANQEEAVRGAGCGQISRLTDLSQVERGKTMQDKLLNNVARSKKK